MAHGIEARISVLEKAVERLGASLGKVTAALSGEKEKAPRKARKPRQPRPALGTVNFVNIDPKTGAIPADDPRYLDSGKKRRGRKKAGEAAGSMAGELTGGEG